MSYLARRQQFDPLLLLGIVISLLLHGGLAAYVLIERDAPVKQVEVPREFVVAKMVRLGRKRPKNWLPSIPQRVTAKAPKKTVGLTDNENAAAAKKERERERDAEEAKAVTRANNLAKMFAEAQKEADQEGDPRGSPTGTATEAQPGDEYATACDEEVKKYWNVPPDMLLPDAVLSRLEAEVRVVIDQQGKVLDVKLTKPSRNRYFDASLKDAIARLKKLPKPPKSLVRDYPRVAFVMVFDGKSLKGSR